MPKRAQRRIIKSKNTPATAEMIHEFRAEMNSKFISHDKRFESIENKLASHDKRFESIENKLASHDKMFFALDKKIDSTFERLLAEIHRVGVLVEEQNARNKVVFDNLNLFKMRLDRIEGIEE